MLIIIVILMIALAFACFSAVAVSRGNYLTAKVYAVIAYLFIPFTLLIAVLFQ